MSGLSLRSTAFVGLLSGGIVPVFESIASLTVGSSGSVEFTNIPQTYQHLQIRMLARTTNAASLSGVLNLTIQFNGDTTSANYRSNRLRAIANSTPIVEALISNSNVIEGSYTTSRSPVPTSTFAASILDIHNYSDTTKLKTVRYISGAEIRSTASDSNGRVVLGSVLWNNTSSINTIRLAGDSTGFQTGTSFALYGIKGS